jgi:hypothetical protein
MLSSDFSPYIKAVLTFNTPSRSLSFDSVITVAFALETPDAGMDFIFGNITVPTWVIVVVALLNTPTAVPRLLLTTVRSQYVGGQLQVLDNGLHNLELYVFENRDHLPVFLRTQVIEPELEK